jgi:ubiquitin C-terminal hydrolase
MIIHYGSNTGGHYTCLINPIDDLWYEYDDLSSKLKKIGTLDDVKENRDYTKNIVGLIYMPK